MFKINAIGSDPELILLDKKSNLPVSAIGLQMKNESVNLYADNVLAEFAHSPFHPSDFAQGINSTVNTVSTMLNNFKDGCTFKIGQCEACFTKDDLSVPEAHEIGCEPFSNAYNPGALSTPQPYENNHRFAGGHIHIAYDVKTLPPELLVQLLDKELLPLDPNDGKTARSDFYGARGSYRNKSYGLEYRATSNFWLDKPELITSVLTDIQNYVNKRYYGV